MNDAVDDIMWDVDNFLYQDEYEEYDDWYDDQETIENFVSPVVVEEEVFVPLNEYLQQVDRQIELQTDFMESIDTIGQEVDWSEYWKQGIPPEQAATLGLTAHILDYDR